LDKESTATWVKQAHVSAGLEEWVVMDKPPDFEWRKLPGLPGLQDLFHAQMEHNVDLACRLGIVNTSFLQSSHLMRYKALDLQGKLLGLF
jgi:hypothetical protein